MSRRAGLVFVAADIAFALLTTAVGIASGAPLDFLVADLVTGMTFVAGGIVAVWLRPTSPAGPMLLACGALWYVGSYAPTNRDVLTHLGFAFEAYYDLVLAALLLILASPRGRLDPRALFGGLAAAMVVRSLGRLLLQDPVRLGCPDCAANPLAIWPDFAAFERVEIASNLVMATAFAAIGTVAVLRLVRGGAVGRRARWPILLAGTIAMAGAAYDAFEYAWTTAGKPPPIDPPPPWDTLAPWFVFGMRTLVPIGFLLGTLLQRRAPGPLGPFARGLDPGSGSGSMTDALRAALGDRSLRLLRPSADGRWSAEDGGDVAGVEQPGRAMTSVGPPDSPLARIEHDRALLDQPELLDAVVRVLRLALENARLEAELRDQLAAVTESRARIVTAAEEERRRVERDLHDGAQQRLVAVMLALQGARRSAEEGGSPTRVTDDIDAAARETAEAVRELRELARGIHPAILEDEGLGAAIAALARRSGIPVEVRLELDGRLPRLVESTAYFTIAEGLTNAQRHAAAEHVRLRVAHRDGALTVDIDDDGRGGASAERGSGLRGLGDRVTALGGRLDIESPEGGGTRIRASIPVR